MASWGLWAGWRLHQLRIARLVRPGLEGTRTSARTHWAGASSRLVGAMVCSTTLLGDTQRSCAFHALREQASIFRSCLDWSRSSPAQTSLSEAETDMTFCARFCSLLLGHRAQGLTLDLLPCAVCCVPCQAAKETMAQPSTSHTYVMPIAGLPKSEDRRQGRRTL